jgi:light-regulated signal transduction histidine kinase (bacteriophytochrome)
LNLARVTRTDLKREPLNLSGLGQQIIGDLQATQPEREVEVVIQDGLTARGDAQLIRVALDNLLRNAWKFSGKQNHAQIEFGLIQQNGQSVYFVRDNGAGFDMRYAGKLFGAFQRLHHQTEFEGTGIGLATVQRIIQRHGGQVWAEGAVNQGATFYFTLDIEDINDG